TWKNCLGGDIDIPKGITTMKGLEVVYEGPNVMVRKTLFIGDSVGPATSSGKIPWKWILPTILVVLGGFFYFKLKRK
ncbi:MAG TPA: hypothetical protein VKH37_07980, partial [Ferruginibacter sp.]|nr:hypothetical protein [Ferruginibacter sp.]